jgi:hypothetical protein
MQLKKPDSIRQALAAATYGLLAHSGAVAAQEASAGQWYVDSALLYYTERDRVRAIEPVVRMARPLGDDESIAFKVVIDSLTGASPSGAVPTTTPQTYTSPSGNATYRTPARETPLDPTFLDTRLALSFEWTRPAGAERSVVYQGHASKEYDYTSMGFGATVKQDFNKRNTTLTAGLSYNRDGIDPVGGVPLGLAPQPAFPAVKTTIDDSNDKDVVEALLGVTQLIDGTTLMQLNYTYGRDAGYLTDPYKLVSVVDAGGVPLQTLYEARPDERRRQALYWRTQKAFGRDVLNVSYRYYWDDWDVMAHTVDVRYRLDFGARYLEPHLRYSHQRQADFYRPFLRQGEAVEHASADYRLSRMTTTTVGLKYGVPLETGELGVRLEFLRQAGDDHPPGAPGPLANLDLFPDTEAILLQINYAITW